MEQMGGGCGLEKTSKLRACSTSKASVAEAPESVTWAAVAVQYPAVNYVCKSKSYKLIF